jgi:DNA-binding beta-propeller fold protein YncE
LFVVACGLTAAQTSDAANLPKPGVKEVQLPFATLKPSATLKIGGSADWVLVTDDAVWVASTKPYAVQRIDPASNQMVALIRLPGEACSGLASGFGSIWAPICGKKAGLARIDSHTNRIAAILPIAPAGAEGGITASADSIWMVTDKSSILTRIAPSTNSVQQRITIVAGSYNPLFSDGVVWITGVDANVLTAVDAATGDMLAKIPVGPKPRFLTAGGGFIWTLNQDDGTISKIDEKSRTVTGTIHAGIAGMGGDIDYGADAVWPSVFEVPLTRIDVKTGKVSNQWVGPGGDSLRIGFDSIWITDYKKGLLLRIPIAEILQH